MFPDGTTSQGHKLHGAQTLFFIEHLRYSFLMNSFCHNHGLSGLSFSSLTMSVPVWCCVAGDDVIYSHVDLLQLRAVLSTAQCNEKLGNKPIMEWRGVTTHTSLVFPPGGNRSVCVPFIFHINVILLTVPWPACVMCILNIYPQTALGMPVHVCAWMTA